MRNLSLKSYSENRNTSKTLFNLPTDAHYYKIIEMIKQFQIITLDPTCFDSRRNHHQGAVLCLAKTNNMVFLRSSLRMQSMLWRHISLLSRRAVHSGDRNSRSKHTSHVRYFGIPLRIR